MALAVFGGGGFSAGGVSVFWSAAAVPTGTNFGIFGYIGLGGRVKLPTRGLFGGDAPRRFLLEAETDFDGFWWWELLLVRIIFLGGGGLVVGAGGGGMFWR